MEDFFLKNIKKGAIIHTVGCPLEHKTYRGSFIYHYENNLLALGLIVGLDYQNPYLDPFKELQRLKTHPFIRPLLENGECVGYGDRALNEGGLQSIPKITFPGKILMGFAAAFLNVVKIKGTHTAVKSGILAADTILQGKIFQSGQELKQYSAAVKRSWICEELTTFRNIRPAFNKGLWPGLLYSALDQFILRGKGPFDISCSTRSPQALKPSKECHKILYPKPDGKLTFDTLTQMYLTATRHREDESCHLIVKNPQIETKITIAKYTDPEQRYCPAQVTNQCLELHSLKNL